MIKLDVKKLNPEAKLPTRSNPNDAGLDLYALEDVFIPSGKTVRIPTGIAVHVLPEHVGLVRDRSSMAMKGLIVGAGVVDAGYAGDVTVVMHNFSANVDSKDGFYTGPPNGYQVKKGDKIAQLLIQAIRTPSVSEVGYDWSGSSRGSKGFGSSGT